MYDEMVFKLEKIRNSLIMNHTEFSKMVGISFNTYQSFLDEKKRVLMWKKTIRKINEFIKQYEVKDVDK